MSTRVIAVTVDCRDTGRMAEFWSAALDYEVVGRWPDAVGVEYVELGDRSDRRRMLLVLQPVEEGKAVKNRWHVDLAPEGRTQAEEVDRLVALGARVIDEAPGQEWIVLADPEDNEFCVLPPRKA